MNRPISANGHYRMQNAKCRMGRCADCMQRTRCFALRLIQLGGHLVSMTVPASGGNAVDAVSSASAGKGSARFRARRPGSVAPVRSTYARFSGQTGKSCSQRRGGVNCVAANTGAARAGRSHAGDRLFPKPTGDPSCILRD